MLIYIATVNGKGLTDPYIHMLLDNLAKEDNSKEVNYVYRCGPNVNDPDKLMNELSGLKDDYKLICYETSKKWAVANDEDIGYLKKLNDKNNEEVAPEHKANTGQILADILREKMYKGSN